MRPTNLSIGRWATRPEKVRPPASLVSGWLGSTKAKTQTIFKFTFSAALILSAFFALPANADTFPTKLEGHGGPIRAIAISEDRNTALTASFDYAIIIWDLDNGEATIRHRLFGHDAAVNDVSFVPNSDQFVSVSDDGSFAIWDMKTGELLKRIEDTGDKVLDVTVSPDGTRAAIARWDGTARLFDLTSQTEVARLEDHRGPVNAVDFSPDGSTLYTGAYDGIVRAYDGTTGEFQAPLYNFGWGINVLDALDSGNSLVFGALDGTVAKISINDQSFKEVAKFDRPVLALSTSPDGKTIAVGNGAGYIHLYDAETLTQKREAAGSFGPIWGMAFTDNNDGIYHVGLDDFASWHDLSSDATFQPVQSEFPRRFQLSEAQSVGQLEFQRKCSVCHTLTPDGANRAGPTLYDVFGRKAGTLPGYDYSQALLDSPIIWNESTIGELFDKGPDLVVPGTKMPIQRLKSIERRNELIDYLKVATAPAGQQQNEGEQK